jgi:hypothetical protein
MKKYLKIALSFVLAAAMLLCLTSCFTSSYAYTEWELTEGGNSLTDGENVYTRYDGDIFSYWMPTDNECIYYINTVETPDGIEGIISTPIKSQGDILSVVFHDYVNYSEPHLEYYVTEVGKQKLKALDGSPIDTLYLCDESYKSAPLSSNLKQLISSFKTDADIETVTLDASAVNQAEMFEVNSLALGGFLKHVHGRFYFYRSGAYYLDLDGRDDDQKYSDVYTLIKLDAEATATLSNNCGLMRDRVLNIVYEEPMLNENSWETDDAVAKTLLLIITAILGIVLPLVPLTISLVGSFKKRWNISVIDYILIASSAIWTLSGIVVFIILLF